MSSLHPMSSLQQQPAQQNQSYYPDALAASTSQPYAYYTQQQQQQQHAVPTGHVPGYSQGTNSPIAAASGLATQTRMLNAATGNPQQAFSHQQLGLAPQAVPATSAAHSASTAATHSQLPQPFVSPHGIPTSLLGHGSAVANAEYGVWFYPHQQIPQPDRAAPSSAAASASVGGMASSANVSPVSQHTVASAEASYPLQTHFDSQMRYMAVPGQPSGIPKPMASSNFPIDRSLRPISTSSHQQHGLAAMQYPSPMYTNQTQYHPSYYPPAQSHPQPLHSHIFSGHYQQNYQQQQQQQSPAQSQQSQQQPSPFPTHNSAMAATAPISDTSSTKTSAAAPSNGGTVQSGAYGVMRQPGFPNPIVSDQVSAAQVAAAVAAVAASAHTIPVSASSSIDSGTIAAGSGASGVAGLDNSRLNVGFSDVEQPGMSAFKFSMGMHSGAESSIPEYFENYSQAYMVNNPPPLIEPSPASPTEQTLDADLMARLDELFMRYLEAICSNNITVDSEGESIHQTQMAKKLEKLEQCTEYRTFRFRIQAFSNGFREFIEREAGLTEQAVSKQQLRNYLHQQHYISRYNEDGKKAKSKGHHVWNVEAKKISRNTWWFKEFVRRIAAPPPKVMVGVPYEWTPTIWDPQIKAPKVYFSSEWLPPWLRWENNTLRGLAPPDATDCNIVVIASYYQGKELCHLKTNFTIHVVPHHAQTGPMFIP
ncbi:hypothetical protein LPJ68_005154 [Coemansia sp. RSA 1086]|nr:hypothetical protein LPJ68_005154 [Coemansia sp. RSA 1086]